MTPRGRWWRRLALAGLLAAAAVGHVRNPAFFEGLVPDWLPGDPAVYNMTSAAAEAASAALLLHPRTVRIGGGLAFVTLATVWVANIDAAFSGGTPGLSGWAGSAAAAWLRLPLQLPLLWWAWQLARDHRTAASAPSPASA